MRTCRLCVYAHVCVCMCVYDLSTAPSNTGDFRATEKDLVSLTKTALGIHELGPHHSNHSPLGACTLSYVHMHVYPP